MRLLFCNICKAELAANALFCEDCGAATRATPPIVTGGDLQPHGTRLSTFFASQATLCLFTLLIFLGLAVALAPAGWRYASLQLKTGNEVPAATSATRSLGSANAPARCNQIVVIFNSTATVSRVSALLEQLDASIAFGPNENGAFELSAPGAAAAGVADALNRAADAVVDASLQRRCL